MFASKYAIFVVAVLFGLASCQEEAQPIDYSWEPQLTQTGFYIPVAPGLRYRRSASPALDLDVRAERNLWRSGDGRSNLDGYANYNRHYGSPGTTRPNYGAGVMFTHRF